MVNRREVAKKAGVSPATVSRVLGNYGSVNPEIAARVNKVAKELGYRPNQAARTLKTNRTGRIGVIVHQIVNPYYAEIVGGIEEQAKAEGYVVSVCAASDVDDLSVVDGFLDQQFDGVVFAASWYAYNNTRLPGLVVNGLPAVFGSEVECPADCDFYRVTFDWQGISEAAVSYLIGLGHKKIAYISTMGLDDKDNRYTGYRAALKKHGIKLEEKLIISTWPADEYQSGQIGMQAFLARDIKPTALLAFNDLVAAGAIAAMSDAGFRVPDDISVMGHDDIAFASLLRPSLSTVRVPKKEQGRLLVWILARIMRGEEIKRVWPIEGGLVIRQTTRKLER
jgi:DNA-binding LacI/PurR family transcriptional regulator